MKRISVKRIVENKEKYRIRAWHLDRPRNQSILEDDAEIVIQGWVFPEDCRAPVEIVLEIDSASPQSYPLNLPAHEAKRKVLGKERDQWGDLAGFHLALPSHSRQAIFSFKIGDHTIPIAELSVTTIFKVQRGRRGHLFLDNDTNRSVDQFSGRLLLGQNQIDRWQEYGEELSSLDSRQRPARLLICPAKEEIFSDLYPHARAHLTPIDQVLSICPAEQTLFPAVRLRSERGQAYSTIDTHWSDYGAKIGAAVYLESIGFHRYIGILPAEFEEKTIYGDLGGKIQPAQPGVFVTLPHSYPHLRPSFDNRISNHGRVWIFNNPSALPLGTIIIFGDSFSVSLSAILASVFPRVVYAYTAAGIDHDLIARENPSHILAQTNQRFVIGAPPTSMSVARQAAEKLSKLSGAELNALRATFSKSPEQLYVADMCAQ